MIELPQDNAQFAALSMPVTGVRFDAKTLAFIDTNKDGRIRVDELRAAVDYLNKVDEKAEDEQAKLYRTNLPELLANFVTMDRLYKKGEKAIFQMGTLFIDGKVMDLTFDVTDVEKHAALVDKSNCYMIYLALTRPGEGAEGAALTRNLCAVVTKGRTAGLYVGRNGLFMDRDGKDWDATVVKVIEKEVSLIDAFFAPWRKLGEAVADTLKKFVDSKHQATMAKMNAAVTQPPASDGANGAALASSVAAVGIGIGMVTAACASLAAALSIMPPWKIAASIAVVIALVSVPSMFLTWLKLRKRDLGVVLNASGWAVNRFLPIP